MKKSTIKFVQKLMFKIEDLTGTIEKQERDLGNCQDEIRNYKSIVIEKNKQIEDLKKLASTTYSKATS